MKNTASQNELKNQIKLKYPCSCPKILIIDDEIFVIIALKMIISRYIERDQIVYALSGAESLEMIKNFKNKSENCDCETFRLIITDINMPDVDGFVNSLNIIN